MSLLWSGNVPGAERARNIANQVGNGMQWWTGLGTLSWDYVTNYVFQQSLSRGMGVSEALGHLSALSLIVGEVTQLRSDSERLQWITRNYSRVFTVAKSTMSNLLSVFDHDVSSKPLHHFWFRSFRDLLKHFLVFTMQVDFFHFVVLSIALTFEPL